MIELKPCPFCGGEASLTSSDLGRHNGPGSLFTYPNVVLYSAQCHKCGISFSSKNEQEAVAKWNSRVVRNERR